MKQKRLPRTLEEKDLDCQLQNFDDYAHRKNIPHFHLPHAVVLSKNVGWVKALEKIMKREQKNG